MAQQNINPKLKEIFEFLGVKEAKELIGKTLMVSFKTKKNENDICLYAMIPHCIIDKTHNELHFPIIKNGSAKIQVYVSGKESYVIHFTNTNKKHYSFSKRGENVDEEGLSRGRIAIL